MFGKLNAMVTGAAKAAVNFVKRSACALAVGAATLFGSVQAQAAATLPTEITDITTNAQSVWDLVVPIIAGVTLFVIAIRFVKKIR